MRSFAEFSAERDWVAALPNVEVRVPAHYCEWPQLRAVFAILSRSSLFHQLRWVIAHAYERSPEPFKTPLDAQTVMIYLSNEDYRIPSYTPQLAMLFTPYFWPGYTPPNLRVIPLGCNGEVPELPQVPWEARELDLFFSGHIHAFRLSFQQQLTQVLREFRPLGQELAGLAVWSSRFRGGLDPAIYARYLSQTRVALIPRGQSAWTFRLFEAMRAGCLLLCEELPSVWFLAHCPRVVMPSHWKNLTKVLEQLWQQPHLMAEMQAKTRENYEKTCCPEAVAAYMLKELSAHVTHVYD